MVASGFTNSFTSGEISEDAWDRVDIQPIIKGCQRAQNLICRIAGPLGKRRGFWRISAVANEAKLGRLIAFRRSVDDAVMLEFGDLTVRVWLANGAPQMDGLAQRQFASPYAEADLDGLRPFRVADTIYLRHRDGLPERTLVRQADSSWAFNLVAYPNGPWRPENTDKTVSLTFTGADEHDVNPTGSGSILVGQAVTILASGTVFDPAMVGTSFRIRAGDGTASLEAWQPGQDYDIGRYVVSNGRVYKSIHQGAFKERVSNPPVQLSGDQSDGDNTWTFRHDGAGVVRIDAVTDGLNANGTVMATLPVISGQATTFWSEAAYSAFRGWPRMWPALVEERLASGATASNLDMLDLTGTADFNQTSETFSPGTGVGLVVATDAVRRRVESGGEILWAVQSTFLIVGAADGENVVSGGLFGTPISPASVTMREVSAYGSEDVYPAKAGAGLFFVARGGQTLRHMAVDQQQGLAKDDRTVLASHIGKRVFKQLAWVASPDEILWARLADGGLAAFTDHEEQQVKGWTGQQLPAGWICEDIAVLPGPGRMETLWMIVSRVKGGQAQRFILQQSDVSDALFLDGADLYQGAPTTIVAGLAHYEGETVRALADGVQYDLVVAAGEIALPVAAARVLVGLGYTVDFLSLKLDMQGGLLKRERLVACISDLKCVSATVGMDGFQGERVTPRAKADIPGVVPRRIISDTTMAGDASRDPRLRIIENTAYDFVLYSLKPKVVVGD